MYSYLKENHLLRELIILHLQANNVVTVFIYHCNKKTTAAFVPNYNYGAFYARTKHRFLFLKLLYFYCLN